MNEIWQKCAEHEYKHTKSISFSLCDTAGALYIPSYFSLWDFSTLHSLLSEEKDIVVRKNGETSNAIGISAAAVKNGMTVPHQGKSVKEPLNRNVHNEGI